MDNSFILRVLKSAPDLRYIMAPDGIKDISEAHIQGYNITAWLEKLKSKAESGKDLNARRTDEQLKQLYQQAKPVIEAADPLVEIENAIRKLGYGGDIKPAKITYLAMTSRLLEMRTGAMPVHLLLTGPSSGGKSYTLGVIKALMPVESYHVIDASSPRVLIYDEVPLEHKALIFGEADSLPAGEDNPAALAIRNLLQDHQLHYEVTIKDRETGDYQIKQIRKPGPTVMITTSTRPLGDQLMTRFFTLEIGDSKEQISAALQTQAWLETKGIPPPDPSFVAFQAYLQLKVPIKVIVPYAAELGEGMSKMAAAPRIHRDFARLLSLIKSVALIRHYRRQVDSQGYIIAELTDYETVRELVNDMYIDSSTGATSEIRKLVETVIKLDACRNGERITNTTLAEHLKIGTMQASRRAKKALKSDWLVNKEQQKYHPADYAPGEPMPDIEGLPMLEGVNTANTVNNGHVHDSELKNGTVNMLTALTAGNISSSMGDISEDIQDCAEGGRNEWTYTPDGKLLCTCGHVLNAGIKI